MEGAAKVIKENGGMGIPTLKPWNLEVIREKTELIKDAQPFAVAMDVNAAGLPNQKNN